MISKKKVFTEIQGFFFRPNTGDLQTNKKKGLHRNLKGFSDRNQKFKGLFPAEIRNSRVFFGRLRVISKNKKVSTKIQTGFSGRNKVISKNRFSPTLGELLNQKTPLFRSKQRQVLHNFGSKISLGGGLFSFLEQKSSSKALETCYFEYFSGQWKRLRPLPALPPGYATSRLSTTVIY